MTNFGKQCNTTWLIPDVLTDVGLVTKHLWSSEWASGSHWPLDSRMPPLRPVRHSTHPVWPLLPPRQLRLQQQPAGYGHRLLGNHEPGNKRVPDSDPASVGGAAGGAEDVVWRALPGAQVGAGGGEWTAEHPPCLCHATLSVCRQGCHRSRWVWICLGWVCCLACTFNIVVILSPCQCLLGLKIGFLSHVFVLPF